MRIELSDVSWTGGRHNTRTVPTCLDLITYAAERGYEIVKAPVRPAGVWVYNLVRGGELQGVAEISDAASTPSVQNITRIPFKQTEGRLERFRHLLRKPAAFRFAG